MPLSSCSLFASGSGMVFFGTFTHDSAFEIDEVRR